MRRWERARACRPQREGGAQRAPRLARTRPCRRGRTEARRCRASWPCGPRQAARWWSSPTMVVPLGSGRTDVHRMHVPNQGGGGRRSGVREAPAPRRDGGSLELAELARGPAPPRGLRRMHVTDHPNGCRHSVDVDSVAFMLLVQICHSRSPFSVGRVCGTQIQAAPAPHDLSARRVRACPAHRSRVVALCDVSSLGSAPRRHGGWTALSAVAAPRWRRRDPGRCTPARGRGSPAR